MMDSNDDGSSEIKLPCAEKAVFDTQKEAASAGLAADWQHGATLKAYKCKHCSLWHLATKQPV
jgi:hypothetical protein